MDSGRRNRLKRECQIVLAILVVTGLAGSAFADLESELKKSTDTIARYCKSNQKNRVTIGYFEGPGTGGPRIGTLIETQLRAHDGLQLVSQDEEYQLKIHGSYRQSPPGQDFQRIAVTLKLVDQYGAAQMDFNASLNATGSEPSEGAGEIQSETDDPDEIGVLLGVSVRYGDIPLASDTPQFRREKLAKLQDAAEEKVQSSIDDSIVFGPTREYGVEVLVEGQPRVPGAFAKGPKVTLQKKDVFTIRLHNNTDYDAAATVTLDGVDSFHFCEDRKPDGSPKLRFRLIPAHSVRDVVGWFINQKTAREFLMTGFQDSVAFQVAGPRASAPHAIAVNFQYAWSNDGGPPPGVRLPKSGGSDPFVGLGGPIRRDARQVQRIVGPVRETIVVRYGTR